MTRNEILALTGRELDESVLERVMGYKRSDSVVLSGWYALGSAFLVSSVPRYSTDHNAARRVLAEIEKRGLDVTFVGALEDIIWPEPVGIDEVGVAWGLLNATPAQICQAALLAVEGV